MLTITLIFPLKVIKSKIIYFKPIPFTVPQIELRNPEVPEARGKRTVSAPAPVGPVFGATEPLIQGAGGANTCTLSLKKMLIRFFLF